MNPRLAAAISECCPEILLWGEVDGRPVEAAFDGYSAQATAWTTQGDALVGSPVQWIVAGPGGPPIAGWGFVLDGELVTGRFGEVYVPSAGDVIEVVPRIDVEVAAGPDSVR